MPINITNCTRRGHLFVNANILGVAKAKAVAIMPDVDEIRFFDFVRLSLSGNLPAQAYGCNTALTTAFVQRWKDEFLDLNPNNCRWYLLNSATGTLIATNSPNVTASGQAWTWAQSMADVGLKRIEE